MNKAPPGRDVQRRAGCGCSGTSLRLGGPDQQGQPSLVAPFVFTSTLGCRRSKEYSPTSISGTDMTSSNRRQRQLARAKFERQQARRLDREDTARVRQRLVAIVVVGALVIAGGGWAIFTLIDRGSEPESTASEIDEVAEELIEEIEAGAAVVDICAEPAPTRVDDLTFDAAPDAATAASGTLTLATNCGNISINLAADDAPAALRSSFVARLAHKEKLAPEDCIQESVSLLIAGHETSSNTACWILHLLATNPDQQAKARAEADAAPATPSYQDFLGMTTLVGAVYETLRLYTIIVGPAKKMTRDDQIPGVPKHTYVLPNKTVMGRCPMQFPSPEKFDCSRYGKGLCGNQPVSLETQLRKHVASMAWGARH